MSKRKSVFVTALLAVLVASLDVCLFSINKIGFAALTGTLALYGYTRIALDFCGWLKQEPKEPVANLELPEISGIGDEEISIDSIIDEIQKEVG